MQIINICYRRDIYVNNRYLPLTFTNNRWHQYFSERLGICPNQGVGSGRLHTAARVVFLAERQRKSRMANRRARRDEEDASATKGESVDITALQTALVGAVSSVFSNFGSSGRIGNHASTNTLRSAGPGSSRESSNRGSTSASKRSRSTASALESSDSSGDDFVRPTTTPLPVRLENLLYHILYYVLVVQHG